MDINNLEELNKWASKLSLEEIENLSEDEILGVTMERSGHPGQFGFMLQLPFFKSQDHFAKTMHALMVRMGKVENLKPKMAKRRGVILKKYKVSAQSLVGGATQKEYIIDAETEESAKEMALNKMIAEESDGVLLDSPSQMLTAEEVGYFYGHKSQPHHITELIDNLEIYIAEMRETEDIETIPKYLKQYAWEYFREVNMDKEALQRLAIFVTDRTYRIIANIETMDNYTRAYFAKVIPYLWDALQNRGVDTFYILDNELRDDRFRAVVELFQLTGMAVVTPYAENINLEYGAIEKQIRDYMAPVRNIMYVEKDASINYLDKVVKLAKESKYLCVFRNKAPDDSKVEVFNSEMKHND